MQQEEAQQQFSQALFEYLQQKKILTELNSKLNDSIKLQQCEQELAKLDVPLLMSYSNYIRVLKNNISIQQDRLLLAKDKKDKCLKLLETAMKKKKAVEKLKEKKYEKYVHDCFIEEQNLLDEIAGR